MATFTENYNLIKPSEEDYYDVQDFNENMDTIDGQIAETAQQTAQTAAEVAGIREKIGSYGDTQPETIFGQFQNLSSKVSTVKSIQRFVLSPPQGTGATIFPIQRVDPSRCIVLIQRLKERSLQVVYTLSAEQLEVEHSTYTTSVQNAGEILIIEFY